MSIPFTALHGDDCDATWNLVQTEGEYINRLSGPQDEYLHLVLDCSLAPKQETISIYIGANHPIHSEHRPT